ncbi:MAG: hypothetical protein ACYS1A_06600 [Planctomycetota bacterium]
MRKRTPSPENYFLIFVLFKVLLLLHPNYSSLCITADTPKNKKEHRRNHAHRRPERALEERKRQAVLFL